ncbi:YidB family protein [Streptomyces olivochromogenes]|uniref:YidB family protein n=1 Tax=Streptomyces olivochromogenes TaxID=1963 RepID=UPI0036AA88A3
MTEDDASRDTPGSSVAGTASSADLSGSDLVRSSTRALLTSPALAEHLQSWLGDGENLPLTPKQVAEGVGAEHLEALAAKADTDPATLAETLAKDLPQVVDQLSPDGRIVTNSNNLGRSGISLGKLTEALNLNPLLGKELVAAIINIKEIVDKDLGALIDGSD